MWTWPIWSVAYMVCGWYGLQLIWSVAKKQANMVCGWYGLWLIWSVANMVCGQYGLWPIWSVAYMVLGWYGGALDNWQPCSLCSRADTVAVVRGKIFEILVCCRWVLDYFSTPSLLCKLVCFTGVWTLGAVSSSAPVSGVCSRAQTATCFHILYDIWICRVNLAWDSVNNECQKMSSCNPGSVSNTVNSKYFSSTRVLRWD